MNAKKLKRKKLYGAIFTISTFFMTDASFALQEMKDKDLADITGKELLQFSTIMPGEMGNPNGDVGFYRLGLDAKIELNSNIRELRLGCDDPSGNGPCDISIDKVVLSGLVPKTGGADGSKPNKPQGTYKERLDYAKTIQAPFITAKNAGPGTDFVMDKPFIELAIKNPNSLVDRKIVGYRFGAKEVWGTMSTGDGPPLDANGAQSVDIIGPVSVSNTGIASTQMKNYGRGKGALLSLWQVMTTGLPETFPLSEPSAAVTAARKARYEKYVGYINASVERGHTGVNYITGRLPVRLNNLNVNASVIDIWKGGAIQLLNGYNYLKVSAETAIVAGRLERKDETDFGRYRDAPSPGPFQPDPPGEFLKGYFRNTFLGDTDTVYDVATYGEYVANADLQGRAVTLKRGTRALLENMIVNVHSIKPDLWILPAGTSADAILGPDTGDRLNTQDISTKTFHQLQYGEDRNGNYKYDPGEGAKHQTFSYQSLDGLQWITTDIRFGNQYNQNGEVVKNQAKSVNGGGYDWLSTRAGWWLESPLANVSESYVPLGQTTSYGTPKLDTPIKLKSLDLGARPIDNCWGELTFC